MGSIANGKNFPVDDWLAVVAVVLVAAAVVAVAGSAAILLYKPYTSLYSLFLCVFIMLELY